MALENLIENAGIVSGVSERLARVNEVMVGAEIYFFSVYHDGSL
jgi:hypothetical protein